MVGTGVLHMITYADVSRRKLDLSPLGLEKGSKTSSYFGTPRGARVYGWEGTDGVHFCSVKALGHMVFSVNPMAEQGQYVHPAAENFEDFLRLLLACGHTAVIEQIRLWDQQQFDCFLKENPITPEQRQVIDQLSVKLGLTPMPQPFEYVKKLQAEFDYSRIPFKKDYWEWVPKKEGREQNRHLPEEWKVYYNGNFGSRNRGRLRPGTEVKLGKQAVWGEEIVYIPSIYACSQGLVADFLTEVNLEREKAFIKKYKDLDEDGISREERERIELENPLELDFRADIVLNGRPLQADRGCGLCWLPKELTEDWLEGEARAFPNGEEILEHYGMDCSRVYRIDRRFYRWNTKKKPKLRTIFITLCPHSRVVPGIHFRVTEPGQQVKFRHPVTGMEHRITIQDYGWQQVEQGDEDGKWVFPNNYAFLEYRIEPKLGREQLSVLDCQEGDRPYLKAKDPSSRFLPEASCCSAIAIIGGRRGRGNSDDGPQYAASFLYFEPKKEIEWRLSFQIVDREKLEIGEINFSV